MHRPTQKSSQATYVGRFAPSPTGPLHEGSLTTALASWLDAKSHQGLWLVRIEDLDTQRCHPQWIPVILRQLSQLGLNPQETPQLQSERHVLYQTAIDQLSQKGLLYACACSRKDIAQFSEPQQTHQSLRPVESIYPRTCAQKNLKAVPGRALRLRVSPQIAPVKIQWIDRRKGLQSQDIQSSVGDFIVKRSDGAWAYQLAVVVDDAAQGINHVVRGEDLLGASARQIYLQSCLNLPQLKYLHSSLVLNEQGQKLSKHLGSPAANLENTSSIKQVLRRCTLNLGLQIPLEVWDNNHLSDLLHAAVNAWQLSYPSSKTVDIDSSDGMWRTDQGLA